MGIQFEKLKKNPTNQPIPVKQCRVIGGNKKIYGWPGHFPVIPL